LDVLQEEINVEAVPPVSTLKISPQKNLKNILRGTSLLSIF
jgi:hypothetical protein